MADATVGRMEESRRLFYARHDNEDDSRLCLGSVPSCRE
jgi:hypothetical protein